MKEERIVLIASLQKFGRAPLSGELYGCFLKNPGHQIIVVTHDRSIARIADIRLEMEDGRLSGMGHQIAPARTITTVRKKKGKKK